MLPILYTSITEGTVPSNYGEGVLSDCLSCSVKEARNGEYELTMEYSAEGIHADAIVPGAFIKAKPNFTDADQLFRIYKVGKTINGRVTINAEHVSYILSDKVITTGTAASVRQHVCSLQVRLGTSRSPQTRRSARISALMFRLPFVRGSAAKRDPFWMSTVRVNGLTITSQPSSRHPEARIEA